MKRYENSKKLLERAKRLIPLASQTFSKSYTRFPSEAPHFLSHGKGGRVWDVDGNEYVDLIGALLPNVLGYCDPDVDEAIKRQLQNGISFSLPTALEADLADRLIRHIPCAEMVRFGKSGTDATSAAVRLARAITGRDHVIMCGYHGWQDWYIGHADNPDHRLGVPKAVAALSHRLDVKGPVDTLPAMEAAAYIVDCSKVTGEQLKAFRKKANSCGAILIFDEVITGFRWHIGGAQAKYGVTPDLACFSKAMGNGMPISALVGCRDIMEWLDRVFFSGTFGGETLSLAAAIACIDKIERENVCDRLWDVGGILIREATNNISYYGLNKHIWFTGENPCAVLNFSDPGIRDVFLTEMLANGVLIGAGHNICFAHGGGDIAHVLEAWGYGLNAVCRALDKPSYKVA